MTLLDPSVVLSKTDGKPQRLTLNPSAPDAIVDGADAGASVAITSGTVLTAILGNDFQPVGGWSQSGATQTVAAGVRRALRQGGPNHAVLTVTWS